MLNERTGEEEEEEGRKPKITKPAAANEKEAKKTLLEIAADNLGAAVSYWVRGEFLVGTSSHLYPSAGP